MITRIFRSRSDIESLSELKTVVSTSKNKLNFRRCVVNKPWGYEYLLYENTYVSAWILFIQKNQTTSMHCHPNKKTTLIVLSGKVKCTTLEGFYLCQKGDGLIIESSVFHKTQSLSENGALIMELESPPNKHDLIRLKDAYGREGKEYEGISSISYDINKYEYSDLHNLTNTPLKTIRIGHSTLYYYKIKETLSVYRELVNIKAKLICLLSGILQDKNGKLLLSAGDAADINILTDISRITAVGDIIYLAII